MGLGEHIWVGAFADEDLRHKERSTEAKRTEKKFLDFLVAPPKSINLAVHYHAQLR